MFVKLEFAANFNALKNTITNFSNRKYPIPDSQVQKTAENTFEMLVNNTVQEINNIWKINYGNYYWLTCVNTVFGL